MQQLPDKASVTEPPVTAAYELGQGIPLYIIRHDIVRSDAHISRQGGVAECDARLIFLAESGAVKWIVAVLGLEPLDQHPPPLYLAYVHIAGGARRIQPPGRAEIHGERSLGTVPAGKTSKSGRYRLSRSQYRPRLQSDYPGRGAAAAQIKLKSLDRRYY